MDPAGDTERDAVSSEAAELIARIRGGDLGRDRPPSDDGLDATDFHTRYKLVRELGAGAMGTVWQATDKKLRRTVAVKFLKPELQKNPIVVERAMAEARAASQARHEHIVEIFDVGTMPDGSIYTVMEWLEGRTLSSIIEENSGLPWKRCRNFLLQLAHAMAHAHRCGITHRDLKPDNILVCARPTSDFCKIIDFGLSKDAAIEKRLTQTGQLLGTPYYMSPEQVLGRSADRRSDVYGLGVIAFELLTGSRPFEGDSVYAVFTAHVEGPLPHVPAEIDTPERVIDQMIHRALAKDPDTRFGSMDELIAALDAIPEEFVLDVPATLQLSSGPEFTPVSRWRTRAALVAAVAAAGVVTVLAWPRQEAQSPLTAPVDPSVEDVQPVDVDLSEEPGHSRPATEPSVATSSSPTASPSVEPPGDAPSDVAPAVAEQPAVDAVGSQAPARKRGERRRERPQDTKARPAEVPTEQPPPVTPSKPTSSSKTEQLFDELGKIDGSRDESKSVKRGKPELLDE